MAQYYYFSKNFWNDEQDEPEKLFLVEKSVNDPHPESILDPETEEEVPVSQYFGCVPSFSVKGDTQFKYQGKYSNFMNKRRESIANRKAMGDTTVDLIQKADLSYTQFAIDQNGKEVRKKKYISEFPSTAEWAELPPDKRKIAEKYGILPQSHFEAPAVDGGKYKEYRDAKRNHETESFKGIRVLEIGKIGD